MSPLSSETSFQWNSSSPWMSKENMDYTHDGLVFFLGTLLCTFLLELCSLDTVQKLFKQPGVDGRSLYIAGVIANFRNHIMLGVPIYAIAAALFCRNHSELQTFDRIVCILTLMIGHSIIFYIAHKAFHASPTLYKHHRFHHRFNIHVTPMAAHAVSIVEYLVAYALPFTVPMPFIQPDLFSLRVAVMIVAFSNLLIHTPKLEEWSRLNLPEWWVTTHDHLEHHRKLNTKFAASTFNIDHFVKRLGVDISSSGPGVTADGKKTID